MKEFIIDFIKEMFIVVSIGILVVACIMFIGYFGFKNGQLKSYENCINFNDKLSVIEARDLCKKTVGEKK